MRKKKRYALALLLPTILLMVFIFAVPMAMFFRNSFFEFYRGRIQDTVTLHSYIRFFSDTFYLGIVWSSVRLALIVMSITIVIGLPLAYALLMVKNPNIKQWMTIIIFSPLIVSVVVRTYGWLVLLADQGLVNFIIRSLGFPTVRLAFNTIGVVISLVHIFLPFMVFTIYSVLLKINPFLKEASNDLGAGWFQTFFRVTLPLAMPGVIAGAQLCFTMTLGAFVTPALLGGGRVMVLPTLIYRSIIDLNWPLGTVAGVALLGIAVLSVVSFNKALAFFDTD